MSPKQLADHLVPLLPEPFRPFVALTLRVAGGEPVDPADIGPTVQGFADYVADAIRRVVDRPVRATTAQGATVFVGRCPFCGHEHAPPDAQA